MDFKYKNANEVNPHHITGGQLLDALRIRGKLATGYGDNFTNEEIYNALTKCEQLLNTMRINAKGFGFFSKTLSGRQGSCSRMAFLLITEGEYLSAMHELVDCIDDYGRGKSRKITQNEYVLYNCVISCFLARLEKRDGRSCHAEIID